MGTKLRTLLSAVILASWVLSASGAHYHTRTYHRQKDVGLTEEINATARRNKRDADYDNNNALLPADTPDDSGPLQPVGDPSDLPTCLLCVCLTGSVYCEEVDPDMTSVPALPKETNYLYARYNKIKKITAKDFGEIVTLKRIDFTGNIISEIEDGAFAKLTMLEELSLAENQLVKLPMLPAKLMSFNANHNKLKTKGIKANAFKKLNRLINLYLAHNELEAVPVIPESVRTLHLQNNNISTVSVDTFCKSNNTYYIRPNMNEIRMDGNPVILAQYPNSFTCLQSLPIGRYQ
ncbi:osteoglycin, paralog a [Myxocyprinus asiaticus]|uniref:osteoglycin, paralog a n=1 Tax=Myxocyprinus asiaticus TaxID=70543 RepID=UPI00222260C4|nr:osteoglycin, paralog a [Myxocyprinus asiaticus]XP_051550179.1 osteoglycin, paralog a [Myxocyprinus asiaticus]